MAEAQEDILVNEAVSKTTDLQSLLEAANTSEFNLSEGITEAKKPFEKASSFFELVKSTEAISDEQEPATKDLVKEETDNFQNVEGSDGNSENVEGFDPIDQQVDDSLIEETGEFTSQKDDFEVNKEENLDSSEQQDEFIDSNSTEPENIESDRKGNTSQEGLASTEIPDDDQRIEGKLSFDTEPEKIAYDNGYKAALDEFEKSMDMEKSSLRSLVQTMFAIGEQFQEKLEELIKMKISELAGDLIGTQVQQYQDSYLSQIEASAAHILSNASDMKLELNHTDFELLKSNSKLKGLSFQVSEKADLRRGEFRLIAGSSGFQQRYID